MEAAGPVGRAHERTGQDAEEILRDRDRLAVCGVQVPECLNHLVGGPPVPRIRFDLAIRPSSRARVITSRERSYVKAGRIRRTIRERSPPARPDGCQAVAGR